MSTRSQPTPGATAFHEFTRAMWTEFKIAADYATGMTEATRGTLHAPGGFVENELGFGLESPDKCGPGCRCTALRSQCARGTGSRRPRTGREWQKLVSRASAAAHAA